MIAECLYFSETSQLILELTVIITCIILCNFVLPNYIVIPELRNTENRKRRPKVASGCAKVYFAIILVGIAPHTYLTESFLYMLSLKCGVLSKEETETFWNTSREGTQK